MKRRRTPSARRNLTQNAELLRVRRQLGYSLLALLLVTATGVIGFWIIGRPQHSLVDAIYMAVITLTTVGFGEIIDMSANPSARMFTVGLLLVGMGVVAYAVPMLAAFLIEGRMLHIFSRRRMDRRIERLTGHHIVCGETATAWYVATELQLTGRTLVIVAPTDAAANDAVAQLGDVPWIVGDPDDDLVLQEAGIERAAGVVVCMADDKDNVLVTLSVRRLAPSARIVTSTESSTTEVKLRSAGADAVVSPSRIGGLRMASQLVRPDVVTFLDQMLRVSDASLRVEGIAVAAGSPVVSRTVGWLAVDQIDGAVLLAIRRESSGAFVFKPALDTVLEPGDSVIAMVHEAGRVQLEERIRTGRKS